ncbi:DNA repair protein RecO [Olsenella umbonata]|uniref:DNA repair protein RecO n=1 Tax=Parafannyhessea umbonata TaxID=604330 RepID=A0A7X9T9S1_9ACTN|nr:DNA repair protein RecO [Parafannyhessea umbonata]NMF25494.1 DNA repair protein RecO [Parafannyhessea umbonata]
MAGRRSVRTRAIVIDRRTRLKEQDLILTLLTQDGQRADVIAKGGLKPGGRLAARVELFSETDFLIASGRSLGIITEAATVNPHAGLRGDMARVSAASCVCEVARLTCFEDMPDPYLFAICSRALTACEQASDQERLDLVVAAYTFKVTAHGGWRPELRRCTLCGDEDVAFFSPRAGGMLCASCAKDVAGAVPMGPLGRDRLQALVKSTFDDILRMELGVDVTTELVSLAHVWAATHLDARLRAFEFMLSL